MTTAKNPVIIKIQFVSQGHPHPGYYYCAGTTRKEAMRNVADYLGQEAEMARRIGAEINSHTNTKLVVTFKGGNQVTYQIAK